MSGKPCERILPDWYRNYFDFAVQTGLRPSEQVALKWEAIGDRFIDIELSRVRNREKADLKNEYSRRRIELRPAMREVLDKQREQVRQFDSPYVFLTPIGTPDHSGPAARPVVKGHEGKRPCLPADVRDAAHFCILGAGSRRTARMGGPDPGACRHLNGLPHLRSVHTEPDPPGRQRIREAVPADGGERAW